VKVEKLRITERKSVLREKLSPSAKIVTAVLR
jgi:hypothetical protein